MSNQHNPFTVGDAAVFSPDQRTIGWYQHSFDRWAVYPGYEGVVTRIDADQVELDNRAESAMHWSQYRRATEVSEQDRAEMAAAYQRRVK